MPQRIQLSRRKGWRKPEAAVVVSRPSKWGNPYRVGETQMRFPRVDGVEAWEHEGRLHKRSGERHLYVHSGGGETMHDVRDATAEECVALFRDRWITLAELPSLREELAGRDLACWCPLDQPCHADVLLELANAEAS
jgi:hypothetical protein